MYCEYIRGAVMGKAGGQSLWLWPFLGLVVVVWIFAIKMDPGLRSTLSFGLPLSTLYNASIVLLVLFIFIAVLVITKDMQDSRNYSDDEAEILEAEIVDEPDTGKDVLEVEPIDEDAKPVKVHKKNVKRKAPAKKINGKQVYEYPRNVRDGVHIDTFVNIRKDTLLKIRTKVAEDNEV